MKLGTVCYLRREDGRRLMITTRDDCFQKGVLNGPGGKVEEGESPDENIVREYRDETGLTLLDIVLRGVVTYTHQDAEDMTVFFYTATRASGVQKEADHEGRLEWLTDEEIRARQRWPGDDYTLEWVARAEREGRIFVAKVTYDKERNVVGEPAVRFQ